MTDRRTNALRFHKRAAAGHFVREDQFEVAGFVVGRNERLRLFEAGIVFDQRVDFFEVGQVIGCGVQLSAGLERAGNRAHEQLIENAVVVV